MFEGNFDGIVGPTHNYSGLSYGNVASLDNRQSCSHPREAALQGLEKMHFLSRLGLKQGIIPPQERPHIPFLKQLGFTGSDTDILFQAAKHFPVGLAASCSAAAMWTANAATICPSSDSSDGRVQLTPANLIHKLHRSIEPQTTAKILKHIFPDPHYFKHHAPLLAQDTFSDEGAANHTRLGKEDVPGVHLFAYGRIATHPDHSIPKLYPARQTLEASQAIARLHQVDPENVVFVQQNPLAIDAGVFHNDVISVGHGNVFLYHQEAFIHTPKVIELLRHKLERLGQSLITLEIPAEQISLKETVASYLFNSQLVTLPTGSMALIAPSECQANPRIAACIAELISSKNNPIETVHYLNVRESMRNGGGPACLRLRVLLNEAEWKAVNPSFILTDALYEKLKTWINTHYRESLTLAELADPLLLQESQKALDALTQILQMGSFYDFQQA